MNISTDSWHYKLVDCSLSRSTPSRSLCKYFWQVVGSIVLWIIMGAFLIFMAGFILSILIAPILAIFMTVSETMIPLVAMGQLIWIGIGIMIVWFGSKRLFQTRLKQEKEPGIVRSYVRAKKEKICPVINFTSKD